MEKLLYYSYETRCRRCGSITAWYLGEEKQWNIRSIIDWGYDQMNRPTICNCKTCDKETIQDLVYFDKYPKPV